MNKLIEVKFGSHLYGTQTPKSDLDLKILYLPSARQICLGLKPEDRVFRVGREKDHGERNTSEDTDVEVFSLDRFLEDLMAGQTWALDMLFAPARSYTYMSDQGMFLMNEIMHFKDRLLTKNINAFVGYAKKQAAKYGIKGTRFDAIKRTVEVLRSLPTWDRLSEHRGILNTLIEHSNTLLTAEQTLLIEIIMVDGPTPSSPPLEHLHVCGRKMSLTQTVGKALECYSKIEAEYGDRARKASVAGGIDWKALSHAVRVNTEALELLQTGVVTFPRPDRELLLRIKTNAENPTLSYDNVADMIEQGLVALTEAAKVSSLRETADRKWAEDLIVREYGRVVTKETA